MLSPVVISAIVSASCISLLSMGFTLQYLTARFPNLAYTDIVVFSAYVALTFNLLGVNPYLALPVGFLAGGCISVGMFRVLMVLKSRGIGPIGLMISTLGLDFVIYGFVNILADYIAYGLKTFARQFSLQGSDFNFLGIGPGVLFVALTAAIVLGTSLHLFLTRTKMGIAMRAIVENETLASSQGINIDRVLSVSWFLVGGLAGVAGILWPMWYTTSPLTGVEILTRILASVVVGGLFSVYGSLFGGFLIGGIEVPLIFVLIGLVGAWVAPYRLVLPVIITIITLVFAPTGITGLIEKIREGRQKR